MDVSEYRKQYEKRLRRAAEEQREGYSTFSDKSKPANERLRGLESAGALTGRDEVVEAIETIRNREEDAELRAATLGSITIAVDQNPDLAISLLSDSTEPAVVRLAALQVLQTISFRRAAFSPKRPEYLAALRTIIDEPDASLRQGGLEILAQHKDEYVQRRLLEGLEDASQALVPPERAVQLLGYDVHAEHYPILRDMVQNPPSPEAKREAVRLLASDPTSKELLINVLTDKDEDREVRTASASALLALAPAEFEEQAKQIVLDDEEDDELRATSITALTHLANQEALSQDAELTGRVEQLRDQSPSNEVASAAVKFLSRQSEQ
jgi:HEAT repeat protein